MRWAYSITVWVISNFSFTTQALWTFTSTRALARVLVNVQRARVVNEKLMITNVVMLLPLCTLWNTSFSTVNESSQSMKAQFHCFPLPSLSFLLYKNITPVRSFPRIYPQWNTFHATTETCCLLHTINKIGIQLKISKFDQQKCLDYLSCSSPLLTVTWRHNFHYVMVE